MTSKATSKCPQCQSPVKQANHWQKLPAPGGLAAIYDGDKPLPMWADTVALICLSDHVWTVDGTLVSCVGIGDKPAAHNGFVYTPLFSLPDGSGETACVKQVQ